MLSPHLEKGQSPGRGFSQKRRLKKVRGAIFNLTLSGMSVRSVKGEVFEGRKIGNVRGVKYFEQQIELDDEVEIMDVDGESVTELGTQWKTRYQWRKESIEALRWEVESDELTHETRFPAITEARLCCINHNCTQAKYGDKCEVADLEIDDLGEHDVDNLTDTSRLMADIRDAKFSTVTDLEAPMVPAHIRKNFLRRDRQDESLAVFQD